MWTCWFSKKKKKKKKNVNLLNAANIIIKIDTRPKWLVSWEQLKKVIEKSIVAWE